MSRVHAHRSVATHAAVRRALAAAAAGGPAAPHAPTLDSQRVRIEIATGASSTMVLGDADAALASGRLTAPERAAVRAVVEAVRLLRVRAGLNGIDDAGAGVRLVLRDAGAGTRGPWATSGKISIGSRNALVRGEGDSRTRRDVLITVDAAVHELVHVTQFARLQRSSGGLHPGIGEGIADAVAMLATGDRVLGEGFYRRTAAGRATGAIREVGPHVVDGSTLGPTMTDFHAASKAGVEEHAAGGVVSTTFDAVWRRLGRDRAEALAWAVIRDPAAWAHGGSWRELAESIQRCATGLWPGDGAAAAAVQAALGSTNLDDALRG